MKHSILITGGGSGIGKALVLRVIERFSDCKVFVVGRRLPLLEQLKIAYPENIIPIKADLADPVEREHVVNVIASSETLLTHVVHSAGVVQPVSRLKDLKVEEYRYQNQVNCEAPLFLTARLLDHSAKGCRFLFVSSGAAFSPMIGLGGYCISKAAMEMGFKVMNEEFKDNGDVLFSSLRPGGVDTPMAEFLSRAPMSIFPTANAVKERRERGGFLLPDTSANFIENVLFDTSDEGYQRHWNINDPSLKDRSWIIPSSNEDQESNQSLPSST